MYVDTAGAPFHCHRQVGGEKWGNDVPSKFAEDLLFASPEGGGVRARLNL